MDLGESHEDYLEAILVLSMKNGDHNVRSVDVARMMNFSKPSVCVAVKELCKKELLEKDTAGFLHLTKKGKVLATQVYERHRFLADRLVDIGVSRATAEKDACRIEHYLSAESYEKIVNSFALLAEPVNGQEE